MPELLLIANWKMNKTHDEAQDFLYAFASQTVPETVIPVICPPFTALHSAGQTIRGEAALASVCLGAQNCAAEAYGAFTGEISAAMLTALHCSYVLLGHSERRAIFAEKDAQIAAKMRQALEHGLRVVLCIGETQQQRDSGNTAAVVTSQLLAALPENYPGAGTLVVAYEPVWAIGTGRTASPQQAAEVMLLLRERLTALYGAAAVEIPLLYGGSVNKSNIAAFASCIDGALVGGASLDPHAFAELACLLAAAKGAQR